MNFRPIDYFCIVALFGIPIAFGGWWIRARLGLDKRWFVVQAWPVVSSSFYFFLPTFVVGSIIFFLGLVLLTLDSSGKLMLIGLGFYPIGFVLAYLEPNWMSPAWYRWLKREHGDIMPYLVMDAHDMGRQAWMQRVETQEGLEEWAAEVRQKYRL